MMGYDYGYESAGMMGGHGWYGGFFVCAATLVLVWVFLVLASMALWRYLRRTEHKEDKKNS